MEHDETPQKPAITDDRLRAIIRELVRRLRGVEARVGTVEERLARVDLDGLEERIGDLEEANARRE